MIDQTTPPFRTGDVAYTRSSPGGYASAAAVPADPAFAGTDKAYAIPSLGGEFQPGSGTAAPTNSPISKGADADGGAADIAGAVRTGAPPAPSPPAVVPLAVTVSDFDLIFNGTADVAKLVAVQYTVNSDSVNRTVAAIDVPINSSAGATAAYVAARVNGVAHLQAAQTSNSVRVSGKGGNVLNTLGCTIAAAVADDPGGGTHGSPPPPPPPPPDDDDDDDGVPGGDEGEETEGEGEPDPDDHSGDPDPQPRRGILKRKARKAK